MSPLELDQSGFVDRISSTIVKTNRTSTLQNTVDSHIDYFVVSNNIAHLIKDIRPFVGTPWSPHIGLELEILSQPRNITGPVLCLPSPLPLDDFKDKWAGKFKCSQVLAGSSQ